MLRRESLGRDARGEDSAPFETPIHLDPVVVQPLDGNTRQTLPEGERNRERILIHSCQELRTSRGGTTDLADIVLYDAAKTGDLGRYVVETSEPWVEQAGMWRCRAVREEDG